MTQAQAEFLYTTYIKTTPQRVWDAITNPEFAANIGAMAISRTGSLAPNGSTKNPMAAF